MTWARAPETWHFSIFQVCIAFHLHSVCTRTPTNVKLQSEVCYSHAGDFTCHGFGAFFPFPDKMTIIDVNYNFSGPCTDDFRSIFWKGGATPIPLVLSFPKTGNFGWLTFRHPPKIIGKIPDVPFDEELIYCLSFQRISGECTQHFNFHDGIHVTGYIYPHFRLDFYGL